MSVTSENQVIRNEKGQVIAGTPNPNGRPVGRKSFHTLFREAVTKIALSEGTTPDDLERELVESGFERARKGDYRYYQDIIDRLHGKPLQKNINLNENVDVNDLLTDEQKNQISSLLNATGTPTNNT
jgi:S-adenosylmethionine:diacylglycerol 3-amino-3-carboxypropyl transferase